MLIFRNNPFLQFSSVSSVFDGTFGDASEGFEELLAMFFRKVRIGGHPTTGTELVLEFFIFYFFFIRKEM